MMSKRSMRMHEQRPHSGHGHAILTMYMNEVVAAHWVDALYMPMFTDVIDCGVQVPQPRESAYVSCALLLLHYCCMLNALLAG